MFGLSKYMKHIFSTCAKAREKVNKIRSKAREFRHCFPCYFAIFVESVLKFVHFVIIKVNTQLTTYQQN